MASRDDDRFSPRPAAPRGRGPAHGDRYVNRILRAVSRAGPLSAARRPSGASQGRGRVAARLRSGPTGRHARRVVIKTRLVLLKRAGQRSTQTYLRYIAREGAGRDEARGRLYGPDTDEADGAAFEARGRGDRHQFRFIVSPEDAAELGDLKAYTRELMARMARDLGTKLDWVAADHRDTDNPHTHVVLRGKERSGGDLVIARDYIAHGMRLRAAELSTEWLGPRTEREIAASLSRETEQPRWTGLDRAIQRLARAGTVDLRQAPPQAQRSRRTLLISRLDQLTRMGVAAKRAPGVWALDPQIESTLRAMGERADIVRTLQRAFGSGSRPYVLFEPARDEAPVVGRIAAKGFADELTERGFLVVDGVDGRAHYVRLRPGADLSRYPAGGIVEVRPAARGRGARIMLLSGESIAKHVRATRTTWLDRELVVGSGTPRCGGPRR